MFGNNNYSKIISSKISELLSLKNTTSGWKFEKQASLFSLFSMKYLNNQINLSKISGVIPVNFEQAVQYYHDGLQNSERKQTCGDLEYLEKVDDSTVVTLGRLRGNLLFDARDILTVQNKHYINDEEVLITRSDIDSHPFFIPNPNHIKADTTVYGIFLKKVNPTQTYLEAYMLFNLRGNIPIMVQNSMISSNADVFQKDILLMQKL